MAQRKAITRIKADEEEFFVLEGKFFDKNGNRVSLAEIVSRKFKKVEIFAEAHKKLISVENIPLFELIFLLDYEEFYLNGFEIGDKLEIEFLKIIKCFLNTEPFEKRKELEELFEEFWILHEYARSLLNGVPHTFTGFLEQIIEISNLLSSFGDFSSHLKVTPMLKTDFEEILKAIWLFIHSVVRFGANEKLLSLHLLHSTIDRIEKIEKKSEEQFENRFLAEFRETFRKIKELRNKSPLAHGGITEVELDSLVWEYFQDVWRAISKTLDRYIEKLERFQEDESYKDDCDILIQTATELKEFLSEKIVEETKNLGALIKSASFLFISCIFKN